MSSKRLLFFSFSLILLVIFACETIHFGSGISEGEVIFDITYPETDAGDLMANILPNEMTLKFKNNRTIGELNAGMGVFKTSLLADPFTKTVYHLVKIMSKKYMLTLDSSSIYELHQELPPFKIHYVDETKEIAGYKCKKAIVRFIDDIKEEFSIYYTDEINIKNPNWFNPFHEINGFLLEYQVRKYNYQMRFTAREVIKSEVIDSEFVVPDGYNEITKKEMDEIFEGFKKI